MKDEHISNLVDKILSENRLYNPKDPVERTAFIKDDEKVANALAFNFFGTIALYMSTDSLGAKRWNQYMKKDKRLQLFAINSYNNDTSLSVKLAAEKGWFLSDAFVTNLTKFLFKLKSGALKPTDIKIDLIGDLIKGLKPEAYSAMAGNVRTAIQEFRRDLNPYEFVSKLQSFATQYKEAGDFFALTKRMTIFDNSALYGSTVSPTGASGTTTPSTNVPAVQPTQTTSTPVVAPIPVVDKTTRDNHITNTKKTIIPGDAAKKKADDQRGIAPIVQKPNAPALAPKVSVNVAVPEIPANNRKKISVNVAVPEIPADKRRDPDAYVPPKFGEKRNGNEDYKEDTRTISQMLNHPQLPELLLKVYSGEIANEVVLRDSITRLIFPAWLAWAEDWTREDFTRQFTDPNYKSDDESTYAKEHHVPDLVCAVAQFFAPVLPEDTRYQMRKFLTATIQNDYVLEHLADVKKLVWKLINLTTPQDWNNRQDYIEYGFFCVNFNIDDVGAYGARIKKAYTSYFRSENNVSPFRLFKFSDQEQKKFYDWLKPYIFLNGESKPLEIVREHSYYGLDSIRSYKDGRNTSYTAALSQFGDTLKTYFPVTDYITGLESIVEDAVENAIAVKGPTASIYDIDDVYLRDFVISTYPCDPSISDIKLRAATIRGFWRGANRWLENLIDGYRPYQLADAVIKVMQIKDGAFMNADCKTQALGEQGIGSAGTLTAVQKSEYQHLIAKFWVTFNRFKEIMMEIASPANSDPQLALDLLSKHLIIGFSGGGVDGHSQVTTDVRNGQFGAIAETFKEELFQYMVMDSYPSYYGTVRPYSIVHVQAKAFMENPKLFAEYKMFIKKKIANRDLDFFGKMVNIKSDVGFFGSPELQDLKYSLREYKPGITPVEAYPVTEAGIAAAFVNEVMNVIDSATQSKQPETIEKMTNFAAELSQWAFDSIDPRLKVNGKVTWHDPRDEDSLKLINGGKYWNDMDDSERRLYYSLITSNNRILNTIVGKISWAKDRWSYRAKDENPRRKPAVNLFKTVLSNCDALGVTNALPEVNILFQAGVLNDMDDDTTKLLLESLADGRINGVIGPDQIKKIYRRADKRAVQTMFFELILDNVETFPDLVSTVYEGLPSYYQQQVRKSLISVNMLKDALMNSPIPPFTDLSLKQIKGMLRVNDIDVDTLLQELNIRKKKGENIVNYVTRAKGEYEKKGVGIIDPFVEDGDNSPNHLKNVTHRYITNNHRGVHGRPKIIYPILTKEFTVAMDRTEFDEFVAEMKASGDHRTFEPCFHGTGGIAASMILRFGFREIKFGDDVIGTAGKALGEGIYLAAHIDKAALYCSNNGYNYGGGNKGYLFVIEPELGRPNEHTREAATGTRYADQRYNYFLSPEWCARYPRKQLRIFKVYECEPMYKGDYYKYVSDMIPENEDGSLNFSMKRMRQLKNEINEAIADGAEVDEIEKRADSVFIFHDGTFPIPYFDKETNQIKYDFVDITHIMGTQEDGMPEEEPDWDQLPSEQKEKYFNGENFAPKLPPDISFEISAVGVEITISDVPTLEIAHVGSSYRLDSDEMKLYTNLWLEKAEKQADEETADPSKPEEDGIVT